MVEAARHRVNEERTFACGASVRDPATVPARPSRRRTLDRALARSGACSRSEAQAAIAAGRVTVNGRVVRDPMHWLDPQVDRIGLDGEPVRARPKVVWMLHKPTGHLTTRSDERGRETVYALMTDAPGWLGPVGRLDKDTSGLLLFTNDTDLADAITSPRSKLEKRYEVACTTPLADAQLDQLRRGVELDDGPTLPARVRRLGAAGDDRTCIEIVITEGRNRQVRRMVAAVGSEVAALHRSAIGPLQLGGLAEGAARELTAAELDALHAALGSAAFRHPGRASGRARSRGSGDRPSR
jgi:pseudouridine synthase